jgi:hypothetical protein
MKAAALLLLTSMSVFAADAPTVDEQVQEAEKCIALMDRLIGHERAVGKEVGVVDQRALHDAGSNKVACKQKLARLQACKRKGDTACALPKDPYAPTRPSYKMPEGDPMGQ